MHAYLFIFKLDFLKIHTCMEFIDINLKDSSWFYTLLLIWSCFERKRVEFITCMARLKSYGFCFGKLKEVLGLWFINHASVGLETYVFELRMQFWKTQKSSTLLERWICRSRAHCMLPAFLQAFIVGSSNQVTAQTYFDTIQYFCSRAKTLFSTIFDKHLHVHIYIPILF